MEIRSARPEEAGLLTRIAVESKGHWEYPESWIQRWSDRLTISAEYLVARPALVAVVDEQIAGFAAIQIEADHALLDHLWVLPDAMGRGIGRTLFTHAEEQARRAGAKRLRIVGDPHAEAFYARMGAYRYGQEPAHMDGVERYLPLLEKVL